MQDLNGCKFKQHALIENRVLPYFLKFYSPPAPNLQIVELAFAFQLAPCHIVLYHVESLPEIIGVC